MKTLLSTLLTSALLCATALAQSMPTPIPVTPDNFVRAETDRYFGIFVKRGTLGQLYHYRAFPPLDDPVVRPNRDTLYSSGVFDLDAGPVTITLPEAGKRFMSMEVVNEDHYVVGVFYGAGSYTFTREQVGTRYVLPALRTFVDPADPKDVEQVHALQDAVKVSQADAGHWEVPPWDPASQKKVREALLALNDTLPDLRGAFGTKEQVDPVRHLIATASTWGGNPDKDAIYLTVTPAQNDGTTVYTLQVKDVPVEAFWSVTVYDATGHFQKNLLDAYSLNTLTASPGADGSVVVQFGGCDGKIPNCLPTVKGWNYTVRLYRPRQEVLDGTWRFPEAQPTP